MSRRYLLDTNVLSEPLRPRPDAGVLAQLERHATELATAAPVWHELWFGCWRLGAGARRDAIERYLRGVVGEGLEILAYSEEVAEWHAVERARLVRAGRTPGFVDGQVAASAAVGGLVLVTRNVRDFAGFHGLEVENWFR